MVAQKETALSRFIAGARSLWAWEPDSEKRWAKLQPLLRELLADPELRARSQEWPARAPHDPPENLVFYEDPEFGFVVNGLIKAPHTRTPIHDHAHNWTLYGVLDGSETIERYERVDDGARPEHAELRQTGNFGVGSGEVDLVRPWQIHAEENGAERTVAIIVRAEKPGGFHQGMYDPASKKCWQGYGPKQVPYKLL